MKRMLNKNLLIKLEQKKETLGKEGTIVAADISKFEPKRGTIIHFAEDCENTFVTGQIITFPSHAPRKIEHGEDIAVINERDIWFVDSGE